MITISPTTIHTNRNDTATDTATDTDTDNRYANESTVVASSPYFIPRVPKSGLCRSVSKILASSSASCTAAVLATLIFNQHKQPEG